VRESRATFGRAEVRPALQLFQKELREWPRIAEPFSKASLPFSRTKLSGSCSGGRNRNRIALLSARLGRLTSSACQAALRPGRVAVEAEHDFVGLPQKLLHVAGRSGRSERRDGGFDPVLREPSRPCSLRPRWRGLPADRRPRLGKAVSSRPFSKSGVSGELRYFGSPSPSTRPPKAITDPR